MCWPPHGAVSGCRGIAHEPALLNRCMVAVPSGAAAFTLRPQAIRPGRSTGAAPKQETDITKKRIMLSSKAAAALISVPTCENGHSTQVSESAVEYLLSVSPLLGVKQSTFIPATRPSRTLRAS
jgi:hypothetical protein